MVLKRLSQKQFDRGILEIRNWKLEKNIKKIAQISIF
jgi:hypothetical protein